MNHPTNNPYMHSTMVVDKQLHTNNPPSQPPADASALGTPVLPPPPLYAAAANGHLRCVQTLLKNGADINVHTDGAFGTVHSIPYTRLILDVHSLHVQYTIHHTPYTILIHLLCCRYHPAVDPQYYLY
jgi:hypothetical protein